MVEKFTCEVPSCGFGATADRMWNLDQRQATDGKRRIVCGKHAHEARTRHGIRAYRLSDTFKRDAEREAQRLSQNAFFLAFKKAEDGRSSRNGHGAAPQSSSRPGEVRHETARQEVQVE